MSWWRYQGGIGQWSWAFHRFTGVGVMLFLLAHVVDTFLVILGPEHYNTIIEIYRHPLFRTMEILLFASVLYHALNGMRIILIDCFPKLMDYHRQLFYGVMWLFVLSMIPVTYYMVKPMLVGHG